jgi:hypothetical protein
VKTVLLTGAGFTYDFGGYLANRMWDEIFNHTQIKKYPKLTHITSTDFDYESIYHKIHGDPQYCAEERKAVDTAVFDAYISLDNQIKQTKYNNNSQPLIIPVNKMIEAFSGQLGGGGFFFTLNQDLYVERYFSSNNTNLHYPYIDNKNIWSIKDKDFSDNYNVIAPQKPLEHPESLQVSKFHYIKLHGAFNWKRFDETNLMVIGQDKERQIGEEPLLNVYSDIFKKELCQKEVRLLVIGYRFADKNINEVIRDSIKNYGPKLAIVAPWQPEVFMQIQNCLSDNRPNEITKNYFPFRKKLSELFVPNDDGWKRIRDILFG